jgi:DNA polymerase epsilon subunit 1
VRAAIGDPEAERALSFPVLPGSHLTLTDPAVELTKFACAVFALARSFENEVGLLTRNALELVGVKAFGEEAAFRNPCAPLRLSGVPCRHCDALRDFDFCRDADLLPRSGGGDGGGEGRPRWVCARCGAEHDRTAVEFELIERVHALERAAAQQDLRCSRCAQVRSDHVARVHDCGGSFNNTVNRTDVRRTLRTMVNVAIVHDLGRLRVSTPLIFLCCVSYVLIFILPLSCRKQLGLCWKTREDALEPDIRLLFRRKQSQRDPLKKSSFLASRFPQNSYYMRDLVHQTS